MPTFILCTGALRLWWGGVHGLCWDTSEGAIWIRWRVADVVARVLRGGVRSGCWDTREGCGAVSIDTLCSGAIWLQHGRVRSYC